MRTFLLAAAFFAANLSAGVTEVALKLPVRPRLAVVGGETIAIAPFVIGATDVSPDSDRAAKIDVQAEFNRYLRKQLGRAKKLKIVDPGPTRLPSSEAKVLEMSQDYWRGLAAKSGADYVISGLIDWDIEDKAGYKTEEYVSPVDGRTYYRQVLVEKTGFVFDIVVYVFDGGTGEKLIEENFRDFKEFDQRNYDELLGLFENLRSLEKQLVGIFVPQETATTRYLFTR